MRNLHLTIIIGIVVSVIMVTSYAMIQNPSNAIKSSCMDPDQKSLQNDTKSLTTRQQAESIVLSYPATKKLIDDSTYCEFMSVSTLYTANGTYQVININLNNTNNLVTQVNLRDNSVISYNVFNLTRGYTAK